MHVENPIEKENFAQKLKRKRVKIFSIHNFSTSIASISRYSYCSLSFRSVDLVR